MPLASPIGRLGGSVAFQRAVISSANRRWASRFPGSRPCSVTSAFTSIRFQGAVIYQKPEGGPA